MNKLRKNLLDRQFRRAFGQAVAKAVVKHHLQGQTRSTCTAVLLGASVGAPMAVQTIKTLDRLWGIQGEAPKATGLLEVYSLHLLSTWLSWTYGDRPEKELQHAREMWGKTLLTLFDDYSKHNLTKFIGRDIQHRFEIAVHKEMQETGERGMLLVGPELLLSDAAVALGGQPLLHPTPVTGYPYDSTRDMMDRGGLEKWPATSLTDTLSVRATTAVGAEHMRIVLQEEAASSATRLSPRLK